MTPASVAALGRQDGRYAYLHRDGPLADRIVQRRGMPPTVGQPIDGLGVHQRFYELGFRAGWADAHTGRQRAAQRFDPLEDA